MRQSCVHALKYLRTLAPISIKPRWRRLDSVSAAETNVWVCFDLQHNGDYDEWFANASTWCRADGSPEWQGTRSSASDASAKQALPFNTDYVDVSLIATAAAVKTPRSIYCYSADSFPITAPNLTDLFPIVRPFMRAALMTGEYCFFLIELLSNLMFSFCSRRRTTVMVHGLWWGSGQFSVCSSPTCR